MRTAPTPTEDRLWQRLRASRLGVRFRRQHAIGEWVVDFVCLPERLVVEVDGSIHETQGGRDARRDANLAGLGFRVLRVTNDRVLADLDSVVEDIRNRIRRRG
jgi:very-short-patch-repair endonuclease